MKLTIRFLIILTCFGSSGLNGQTFYNFEEFFNDTAFVMRNNVKIVTMKVPDLLGDTVSEMIPHQRLCFNSAGKITWYESRRQDDGTLTKYYQWFFYRGDGKLLHVRRFERCIDRDSMREEATFRYDEKGRLYNETHDQIYVGSYHDWYCDYVWYGDSVRIKYLEDDKTDTTRYDEKGRIVEYTQDANRFLVEYNYLGQKSRVKCFQKATEEEEEELLIDEFVYHYDDDARLVRLERKDSEIVFKFNEAGLPISSRAYDKATGHARGFEIVYDYEFRDRN